VRRTSTTTALSGLARAGALPAATAATLAEQYRFLRMVSTALRLLGARPTDTLELAGPMPARVASALGLPSRDAFLTAYRDLTTAVRREFEATMINREEVRSREPSKTGHPRPDPGPRHPLQ
jgi:glutamine synthetase adenylyltransferase